MQLTFTPGVSRLGVWRATIEGVRLAAVERGQAVGERLIEWAIAESKKRRCTIVQLTTDKSRESAHRFYEKLGFVRSHIGYKLDVGPNVLSD
jgi:GNAT superfamily N-acetyltransferase